MDKNELTVFGECVHGNNLSSCSECNLQGQTMSSKQTCDSCAWWRLCNIGKKYWDKISIDNPNLSPNEWQKMKFKALANPDKPNDCQYHKPNDKKE